MRGYDITSCERRRKGFSRQRILEHLRSNLACFGNIFKWLFINWLFFTMYIKKFRRANGRFNPKPPSLRHWLCVEIHDTIQKAKFWFVATSMFKWKPYTVLAMSNHSSDIDSLTLYYCTSGVSKLRPAGQIRPAKVSNPTRGALLENRNMGRKQWMTLKIALFSRFNHASQLFQSLNVGWNCTHLQFVLQG